MKIGIVGLPQSGKTELFEALTGVSGTAAAGVPGAGRENRAVVKVPDVRLDRLTGIFKPEKSTPAGIEYLDFAGLQVTEEGRQGFSNQFLATARASDALLVVVRAFRDPGVPHPLKNVDPVRDLRAVETEFILADLAIIENRMDRLAKEMKSRKNDKDAREMKILEACRAELESEKPLRRMHFEREDEILIRGFRFLTQKPVVAAVNIDENDIAAEAAIGEGFAAWRESPLTAVLCLSARLEKEIQQLEPDEASRFLRDFGLTEPARSRLIAASYRLLGLISFFTVGGDEVKAWTIRAGTPAVQAAAAIHSDIERGFIRAEVAAYEDFISGGSLAACKTAGALRLEGKDYSVADGDIINFRFAV